MEKENEMITMTKENKKVMKVWKGSEMVDKNWRNKVWEISLTLVNGCESVNYLCCVGA